MYIYIYKMRELAVVVLRKVLLACQMNEKKNDVSCIKIKI